MPATRGKWGKSNACAWSTQHAHQKQHPCTVRHHPVAHIAHGYGLAHAPVSARAKMIDLLPHLDSLVVRCSAVQGTSRKGGRAPLCPRADDVVHDLIGHLVSLFDQLDRLLVSSCLATASLLFLKPCHERLPRDLACAQGGPENCKISSRAWRCGAPSPSTPKRRDPPGVRVPHMLLAPTNRPQTHPSPPGRCGQWQNGLDCRGQPRQGQEALRGCAAGVCDGVVCWGCEECGGGPRGGSEGSVLLILCALGPGARLTRRSRVLKTSKCHRSSLC